MDVFRFVSWWWNKRDTNQKILIALWSWLGIMILNLFIFGLKAFLIFAIGIAVVGAGFLIHFLTRGIRKQWAEYQLEREAEAQLMIHKLKGTDVDEDGNEITSEDILRRLRMRANLLRAKKKKAMA